MTGRQYVRPSFGVGTRKSGEGRLRDRQQGPGELLEPDMLAAPCLLLIAWTLSSSAAVGMMMLVCNCNR